MTYNDLCNDIMALGFETELESPERVLSAVRRALTVIFTERPLYKRITLRRRKISPIFQAALIHHTGGKANTVTFRSAKAYSFRTDGVGSFIVRDNETELTVDFSGYGKLHRGFLHGDGSISFIGDYTYTVCELGIFGEVFSDRIEDIPGMSGYTEYDMNLCCDDFLSFVYLPTDEHGMDIKGATPCDSVMRIPDSYTGRIDLTYKCAPPKLTGNLDDEISLPTGCEHLPALLAAAYIWLDDDADKAQYYMNLYREGMSAVRYHDRRIVDNQYRNMNGWA